VDDATKAAANSRKAATSSADESGWDPKKEGTAFLNRHPEARQALRERFLAGVRSRYGALFKTLGLSPEQSEQLALLIIRGSGLGGTGANGGKYISFTLDPEGPKPERGNAIRNLLGEQGWQKYLEYEQLLPARELTTKVASRLSFTDAPLSPTQSDQLVALLASNQAKEPKVSVQQFNWDAILREAREFLSPTQQTALEFSRAEADFHLAMNRPANAGKSTSK